MAFKACKPVISEYKKCTHTHTECFALKYIFRLKNDFTYPLQSSDHRFEEEYTSHNPYSLDKHEERCGQPF